jgi:hypothetical protein
MRRVWVVSVLCCALVASFGMAAGVASAKPAGSAFKCPKGFKKVKKTVRKHGKKRTVFRCRKRPVATISPVAPGPAVPTPVPAPGPAPPAKQLSTTSLSAAYEDLPPAKLNGTEFRIGQYTLSGAVTPFAVPDLRCFGTAECVEPTGSLASGSLVVPLLAKLEYVKNRASFTVGVAPPVGAPGWFSLGELATGSHFFQALGSPDPLNYLPSSARAPIQITSPHLPGTFLRENAFEDTGIEEAFQFQHATLVGTYKKLGGKNFDLVVESTEFPIANNDPSCRYQIRVSQTPPTGGEIEWSEGFNETVFANVTEGSKQIEIWTHHVGGGGGTKTCGLTFNGRYLITEKPH